MALITILRSRKITVNWTVTSMISQQFHECPAGSLDQPVRSKVTLSMYCGLMLQWAEDKSRPLRTAAIILPSFFALERVTLICVRVWLDFRRLGNLYPSGSQEHVRLWFVLWGFRWSAFLCTRGRPGQPADFLQCTQLSICKQEGPP